MCLEVLDNLVWKWTHTHTRWYWYEYMNARLKICQPHTHYNDVYYTWLPKYGQKNLVLPSIYTVYGDFWKGLLWYWCLGAIWIFTMTWKKERGLFIYWRRKQIYENDFFLQREGIIVCLFGSFPFGSLDLTLNCEFDGLRLKSWFLLVILREIN